jgi:hypothetical protein
VGGAPPPQTGFASATYPTSSHSATQIPPSDPRWRAAVIDTTQNPRICGRFGVGRSAPPTGVGCTKPCTLAICTRACGAGLYRGARGDEVGGIRARALGASAPHERGCERGRHEHQDSRDEQQRDDERSAPHASGQHLGGTCRSRGRPRRRKRGRPRRRRRRSRRPPRARKTTRSNPSATCSRGRRMSAITARVLPAAAPPLVCRVDRAQRAFVGPIESVVSAAWAELAPNCLFRIDLSAYTGRPRVVVAVAAPAGTLLKRWIRERSCGRWTRRSAFSSGRPRYLGWCPARTGSPASSTSRRKSPPAWGGSRQRCGTSTRSSCGSSASRRRLRSRCARSSGCPRGPTI